MAMNNKISTQEIDCAENFFNNNLYVGKFNKVVLVGKIIQKFQLNHQLGNVKFYETKLLVKRGNNIDNYISIIVREQVIGDIFESIEGSYINRYVQIYGEIRTYQESIENSHKKLTHLYVYPHKITIVNKKFQRFNIVRLEGLIYKKAILVNVSGRKLLTFLLMINQAGKVQFINCFSCEKNYFTIKNLEINEPVILTGWLENKPKDRWGVKHLNQTLFMFDICQ